MKISTGISKVDSLLSGGMERGSITHIYGESGSGKTTFCLQSAAEIAINKKTIYIASPQFSAQRFKQIIDTENSKKIASNVIVFQVNSLEKHEAAIKNIKNISNNQEVGLIILDSPAYIGYTEKEKNNLSMINQILYLLSTAKKQKFPILLSNQVYTNINKNELIPIGGKLIKDISKDIIKLEKKNDDKRKLKLKSKEITKEIDLKVTKSGLK
ncbi:RecA/RadA recombinase [Methanonatronarchaeum thermophilum]|uniref:DNA repair and recombination protein RadB n=1 Tax=Methanonatronarchaeum thermophilum TaxID=1927129 RepID=A0A1Y3GDH2_9EURY|nr:ATPase domain-containing protein [Methanonatronarchaeum thermophilum]OUJ19300.1 RecA/RadA recombinase [Methanonatronarchaeum thermophilum]